MEKSFVTLGRRSAETLGTRERFGAIGVQRKRVNEITKQLGPEVHCALYVDHFTIFVSAATITHSTRIIQIAINNLEQWTKTKGMRFSIEKTVAIKFEKRKKGEEPQLTLHGSRVQVRESTRYLGLIIDKRLNWKDHVDHLRAKCTS